MKRGMCLETIPQRHHAEALSASRLTHDKTLNEDTCLKVNAENKMMIGASMYGCSVKESDNEA